MFLDKLGLFHSVILGSGLANTGASISPHAIGCDE
jgi:hypothetical protein